MIICDAGIEGNSSHGPTSCSKMEVVVIIVTLPLTKIIFILNEDKYIASVATTAHVFPQNVKILRIDEISTRFSRTITGRLLLSTSVRVQTSVLIAIGQQTNIRDQSVLNGNLNKNGLPSGTLVVQNFLSSVVDVSTLTLTPTPSPGGIGSANSDSGSSQSLSQDAVASSTSSSVPIGVIVGSTVGFACLLTVTLLVLRSRGYFKVELPPPPPASLYPQSTL